MLFSNLAKKQVRQWEAAFDWGSYFPKSVQKLPQKICLLRRIFSIWNTLLEDLNILHGTIIMYFNFNCFMLAVIQWKSLNSMIIYLPIL